MKEVMGVNVFAVLCDVGCFEVRKLKEQLSFLLMVWEIIFEQGLLPLEERL